MSNEDREHPVLPEAWRYEIVGLFLDLSPEDGEEAYLDLHLRRDGMRRVLRFWSPQDLEIQRGGPVSGGLQLFDVSDRQFAGLGVRVDDGEASTGSLRFLARDVAPI
ncbi:MAG: hypothetical protein JWO05_1030 [Gemmatimonadetes bacterium]|nr:hypothetical protein [Gemmatimonadota bacterium]